MEPVVVMALLEQTVLVPVATAILLVVAMVVVVVEVPTILLERMDMLHTEVLEVLAVGLIKHSRSRNFHLVLLLPLPCHLVVMQVPTLLVLIGLIYQTPPLVHLASLIFRGVERCCPSEL